MGNGNSKKATKELKEQLSEQAEAAEHFQKLLLDVEKELKEQKRKDKLEPEPKAAKTPWREMEEAFSWGKEYEEELKNAFGIYKTEDAVKYPRILLLGQIHAGKSSFINSVATIDKGRIARVARAGEDDKSETTKLKIYRPQRILNKFRILDTMGIEEDEGFNVEDIEDLIAGSLKSNYKFNTRSRGDDADRKKNVTQKKRVHCVVVVADANNFKQEVPVSEN
ncbi:interferon-induced protein 44-like, partial [Mercenaria mercenaria]|uniref:interferon-induced protein 44-like n=1 Tax=Mercenaria mercenaria TaxID=6596 RepID=UPI00234ED8A7